MAIARYRLLGFVIAGTLLGASAASMVAAQQDEQVEEQADEPGDEPSNADLPAQDQDQPDQAGEATEQDSDYGLDQAAYHQLSRRCLTYAGSQCRWPTSVVVGTRCACRVRDRNEDGTIQQ